MSDSELAVIGDNNALLALLNEGGEGKFATADAMKSVVGTGLRFLPYIQVANATSQAVTQRKTGIGTMFLTQNKEVISLQESFVCLLLAWRPKAMQYSPEPKSFYDTTTTAFKEIERLADQPDSGKAFGPEFLLWLPERQCFATFFFGSKTARNEAPNVISLLRAGKVNVRFNTALIQDKSKKRSWYSTVCEPTDVGIQVMPSKDDLVSTVAAFKNPPSTDAAPSEKAEESTRD